MTDDEYPTREFSLLSHNDPTEHAVLNWFVDNLFPFSRPSSRDRFEVDHFHSGAVNVSDRPIAKIYRVSRPLALSSAQKREIRNRIEHLSPLIQELREELCEKELRLASLQPHSCNFIVQSATLSNEIGTLATQIALISSKLLSDVYELMTTTQQESLRRVLLTIHGRESIGE